jgi:hypothetical protein
LPEGASWNVARKWYLAILSPPKIAAPIKPFGEFAQIHFSAALSTGVMVKTGAECVIIIEVFFLYWKKQRGVKGLSKFYISCFNL